MKVNNPNRAFMRKIGKGRFVVDLNVDGVQKTLFLYPELDDEGQIEHWSGPIKDKDDGYGNPYEQ